jgi:integrase
VTASSSIHRGLRAPHRNAPRGDPRAQLGPCGHEEPYDPRHGTKSGKSRGIPINDPLLEELRRLPRHLRTDYVFWNHETETRFVSIKKVWATTLRKVGIANFRFHDLRHTFASYVQMGLGDLRATQLVLGHADPGTPTSQTSGSEMRCGP